MHENIMTLREYRAIKEDADRKALYAKYFKPIKAITAVSLAAAIVAGGSASALAATGPTLGPAPTVTQIAAAQASAPSETITGVSETVDGLNIDVSMSDASTVLSVNTIADDGAGNYKIQVLASGITAGNWTDAVGQTFTSPFGADTATVTVTAVNGNMVDLDVSLTTAPSITPNFSASGSATGPAPGAPKTAPTVSDVREILDTTTQATATWDVLAKQTPSPGYAWDTTSLMFINSVTGSATPTQRTNGATLAVVNGKVDATSIPFWSGFANQTMTAKELWVGAGTEPAGWTPATITFQLKLEIVGAEPVQTSPTDCTVAAAPSGSGFSVSTAVNGSTGLNCNLVAVADTVSIAPDAAQATVKVSANDTTTNSSYTVDPESIEFRTADGSGFAKDVTYPGQFSLSYDSTTGLTTVKRLGTFNGTPQVLYRVSESKLDANENKLVGGSASALLELDFAPVTTPETPITVPETPVVPETLVTVVPETPVPAPVATTAARPFVNIGNTSAAPASKAASVTPQGSDNTGISLAAIVGLIALGAAGAFTVKARHRKVQTSDVSA